MEDYMAYYIGLDVSQKSTAICVVDDSGKVVAQGSALSRPGDISGWIHNRLAVEEIAKVGLEASTLSSWLYTGLVKAGFPVLCLEAFQAHRFLATQRNKTDKNDVRGLAQLVRMGGEDFLKLVVVRSQASQEMRALLAMRQHLVE
jgi:transposase